jgi:CIC family chloride channel protein
MSQISLLMIVGGITGILAGLGAIVVIYMIRFFQKIALGPVVNLLATIDALSPVAKILIPTVGLTIVGFMVNQWAKEAKGHGVPEVMSAIALKNGVIRPIVVLVKTIASALTIAVGGSVGREGPIVQIGAGLGSTIGQILKFSPERTIILVGCGAAAGIAATFNAPIAGAFFALEVIIGNFALRTFSPIVLSSVLATVVSRSILGDTPTYQLAKIYVLRSVWEIPLYIIFGIITGAVAILFIKTLDWSEQQFEKIKIPPYFKTTLGGLLLGIVIIFIPNVYGTGHSTIEGILNLQFIQGKVPEIAQHGFLKIFFTNQNQAFLWVGLILLLFGKLLATNITLGSGASGGIFVPSLFLGATAGAIYGMFVRYLFPTVTASIGAYAIVGMGALVAGTTHAPITASLILFELTNDYKIILPMMITCTLSTLLSRAVNKESIFTIKLARQGIFMQHGSEAMLMKAFKVKNVMLPNPPSIPETTNFKNLVKVFLTEKNSEYFITDPENRLVGMLSLHHLKGVLNDENLQDLVLAQDFMDEPGNNYVLPDDSLADCLTKFSISEMDLLPVIESSQNPILLGYISHNELINLYDREILKKNVAELKFVRENEYGRKKEQITLPKDYDIEYVKITSKNAGQTISALSLRTRFDISIIAIQRVRPDGSAVNEIPHPDTILQENDLLFIVGKYDDIQRAFH